MLIDVVAVLFGIIRNYADRVAGLFEIETRGPEGAEVDAVGDLRAIRVNAAVTGAVEDKGFIFGGLAHVTDPQHRVGDVAVFVFHAENVTRA